MPNALPPLAWNPRCGRSSAAECGSIRTPGTCSPGTRACTRSSRSAWCSPAMAARRRPWSPPPPSSACRSCRGGPGPAWPGSLSVRYGMTIDHVLALDVVLSDASTAAFGALPAAEVAARAARPTLEGAICRELPALAARPAVATGYPRFWRQSGGYRLDRLAGRGGPGGLDLARFVVGSEGTL